MSSLLAALLPLVSLAMLLCMTGHYLCAYTPGLGFASMLHQFRQLKPVLYVQDLMWLAVSIRYAAYW